MVQNSKTLTLVRVVTRSKSEHAGSSPSLAAVIHTLKITGDSPFMLITSLHLCFCVAIIIYEHVKFFRPLSLKTTVNILFVYFSHPFCRLCSNSRRLQPVNEKLTAWCVRARRAFTSAIAQQRSHNAPCEFWSGRTGVRDNIFRGKDKGCRSSIPEFIRK